MPRISFFSNQLKNNILKEYINYEDLGDIDGIIMLKNQSSLKSGYMFILDITLANEILPKFKIDKPVTVFLSNPDKINLEIYQNKFLNCIETDLDIVDLYNEINILISNYRYWSTTLMKSMCNDYRLDKIVKSASEMLKASIFILNTGYRVIEYNIDSTFSDEVSEKVALNNSISLGDMDNIFSNNTIVNIKNHNIIQSEYIGETKYYRYSISHNDTVISYILIATNEFHENIDIPDLLITMSNTICKFLVSTQPNLVQKNSLFSSFIKDIRENKITQEEFIQDRMNNFTHPYKRFLFAVVLEFPTKEKNLDYICVQLEVEFPNTNISVYSEKIYILFSCDARDIEYQNYVANKMSDFIKNYNGMCGISNYTYYLTRIRTIFILAEQTLSLGKSLSLTRNNFGTNVFRYNDYSIYVIINECAKSYIETFRHDDIMYLVHPSIIEICRYDIKHKNNLRDVLFYYLIYGKSITKTAEILYMHRNTVQNKLSKINQIIEISYDDGYLQQQLLLSCMIMRYYEEYMNKETKI